ncbi:putative uncharacterized protein [Parachlamydia acanthamoebae UV-7]|uniref:Uncharacterized protein n=2 Tax=Parachlamydia acanthamoebae TaxID=83552 RepID=F8KYS6_PARAV|nr:hypothetical protein [Parachlamydia acanthamoebae]KIA78251.1 hypothetical protein DB43_EJ00220 [Parachlamydia acanthamoebae]CCB86032.1 putative uncharacterized protein [Parachlamydia acanthamoebae UV-7]
MDINSQLPSNHSNPSIPFNQPSQSVEFDRLMAQSQSNNLPFLTGILSLENLKKIELGETDHVEIRMTHDLLEFVEAIKNNTAVMIQTSHANTPVFKFSKEINRLIHDQHVHEFTVSLGDQTKGYHRNAVQTEKYVLEDMRALDAHFLEELTLFFQGNHQNSQDSYKEQQKSIASDYQKSQQRLGKMRERALLNQEKEEDHPKIEMEKEKVPLPEKAVGEGTLFDQIVDKQERASIEAQEQKEQTAEVELKKTAKAKNLQIDGDNISMVKREDS